MQATNLRKWLVAFLFSFGSLLPISFGRQLPDPKDSDVQRRVGLSSSVDISSAEQLISEAALVTDRLVETFPKNPDALEVQARFRFLIGQTEQAKQSWTKCLEINPKYAYATHGLGLILAKNSQFAEAEVCFKEASVGLPNYVDCITHLSDVLLKQGKISEAIKVLDEYCAKHNDATETWVRLGHALIADQAFDRARIAFEKALSQIPDIPKAQQGLATAYLRLGNRKEAKRILDSQRGKPIHENMSAAIRLENERHDIAERYFVAARVYGSNGSTPEALALLERAIRYHETNLPLREAVLQLYLETNQPMSALFQATELARLKPENGSYHYTLGVLASQNKAPDLAIASFEKVIQLAPKDPKAYLELAKLHLIFSRSYSVAARLAKSAVELQPSAASYAVLGAAQAANGDLEQSAASVRNALQFDPKSRELEKRLRDVENALKERRK